MPEFQKRYPTRSLEYCVAKLRELKIAHHYDEVTYEEATRAMGFSLNSGTMSHVFSSLQHFGLISKNPIRITSLGSQVLEGNSLHEAAMKPVQFARMNRMYPDATSDEIADILARSDFKESSIERFVRSYRTSLEYAGSANQAMASVKQPNETARFRDWLVIHVSPSLIVRVQTTEQSCVSAEDLNEMKVVLERTLKILDQ